MCVPKRPSRTGTPPERNASLNLHPRDVGMFRFTCFDEAGAIAFPHVGKQRKLRNGEDFAADVFDGTVHFALFVFKNA